MNNNSNLWACMWCIHSCVANKSVLFQITLDDIIVYCNHVVIKVFPFGHLFLRRHPSPENNRRDKKSHTSTASNRQEVKNAQMVLLSLSFCSGNVLLKTLPGETTSAALQLQTLQKASWNELFFNIAVLIHSTLVRLRVIYISSPYPTFDSLLLVVMSCQQRSCQWPLISRKNTPLYPIQS